MKSLTRKFLQVIAIGGLVFMTSCEDDDTTDNPDIDKKDMTVKEVMEDEEDYSHMNEAVEESDQSDFYSNTSANITVFVATNQAFEDLFAEANVTSVSELEAQMGEEAFARMIMYHAVNGKFKYSDFQDGHHETFAEAENEGRLTVYVDNDDNARLVLNGNDENGASTTSTSTIEASNGNMIEVDAVIKAQSNYENIEDSEEQHESHFYVDVMANAEAAIIAELRGESENNTVLIMNDAQAESFLSVYLQQIIDVDDLQAWLDANAQADLFNQYNVATLVELMAEISYGDLLSASGKTTADIFAELDAESRTSYMSHCLFSGYADFEEKAQSNTQLTSEAGMTYDVSSNVNGNFVLTDSDGNQIILDGKAAQSMNGEVYTVAGIE